MARGAKCPKCKYFLRVKDERWEEKGNTIWYECANRLCTYAIKTFVSIPPERYKLRMTDPRKRRR